MNLHRTLRLLAALALVSLLAGCQDRQEEPTAPPTEKPAPAVEAPSPPVAEISPAPASPEPPPALPLLAEPLEPRIFELPAQALAEWRRHRGSTLVLFSQDPFLQRIPPEMREPARDLIRQGEDAFLLERFGLPRPDPVLMPLMAVSAALEFGLFPEVVWVVPTETSPEELKLEQFRLQLVEYGAVSEEEAATFERGGPGLFTGRVRGVPFHIAHPEALPALDRPIVLHIDLSFFSPLYKGEIKTPLYPLTGSLLTRIRNAGWNASGVTFSLSNRNGDLPLETRFLGPDLASVFEQPALMDQPMPKTWDLRSRALYLENFMKTEEIADLYRQALEIAPDDPAFHFGLYKVQRQLKKGNEALASLARAVELDPVYGMEYLKLAPVALEKGRPDESLRMLSLAAEIFPEDPFITLRMAEMLIGIQQFQKSRSLLEDIQRLPWSEIYYPWIFEHVQELETKAAGGV